MAQSINRARRNPMDQGGPPPSSFVAHPKVKVVLSPQLLKLGKEAKMILAA